MLMILSELPNASLVTHQSRETCDSQFRFERRLDLYFSMTWTAVSYFLFVEAIVNIVSGLVYILSPALLVENFLLPSVRENAFTLSVLYESVTWFGSLVLGQAVLMLLGAHNSSPPTQRIIYWYLFMGEVRSSMRRDHRLV